MLTKECGRACRNFPTGCPTSASKEHRTHVIHAFYYIRQFQLPRRPVSSQLPNTYRAVTMSAEALPITPARFAAALADLPISSLYAKHAELTNNIIHLESSNKQLEDFAREHDDRDCYEALLENRQVMKNFNERMDLIRKEVEEVRGLPWRPRDEGEVRKEEGDIGLNGTAPIQNGTNTITSGAPPAAQEQNSTAAQNGEDEEGVYL
ncbi:uncharacterized protein EKO05_0001484 [Ascochyta rabiei]|nr:uncharacterized protein EKO05_0001484 [Ascochyta rabiei]UPX10846.1 hypothetical protein EKO05_0001484 [Ascochyta rabiei]